MVCDFSTPGVVACGPPAGVYTRLVRECGECKRRHRFIERWGGAYYGSTFYGGCGDTWQDGEMFRRPLERGWRKKAKESFRAMWDHAAPTDLCDEYVHADVSLACARSDAEIIRLIDEREAAHAAIIAAQNKGA